MSGFRVLVGTRKGAFVLTSDGARKNWTVNGPHFPGWEMYHIKGSPVDPNRLYASQSSGWFGQIIQRSDDGGKSWNPVDNKFAYDGIPGTHMWYDGTPHPWEFKRVWHLEPSLTDRDTVYAGVEDAALFKSTDGGVSWNELSGLRGHGSGAHWQPGAGGMCLQTIVSTRRTRIVCSSRFRRRGHSAPKTVVHRGPRSTKDYVRRKFPTRTQKSVTACTVSRCTRPTPIDCTCRSIGTSCAATTAATTGTK